ncbi:MULTISPECIES: Bug family tripartite tricarboxylate transporter substrate binding protein [unclassified Variovorax]|uniref:Bug family tripartite tricarboxylate transporter substrate binding protein n=1 Tax=unclassified Variovorax TaxID=663243 RepID=UPI000881C388|nr:tripartite tricarboxylate transporter substrate binding protein [Variovorax sp. CF079]SDD32301.1 Tripartite-type tricarboxylate transporter, receptor component TctC [Variovorax sp. CF079]
MQRRTFVLALPPALIGLARLAHAQAYPNKPIRYIVPVSAGGGSDMVGRTVTERWGKALNQTFVVDNQGGGGGVIASQNTARAPADGYTLMQGYVATHGTSPATRKLPYDAVKDFTPIGMIGGTPNVLVVNADVPAKDFKQFVAYAKANPSKISYGSAGAGSLTHLTMELFKQQVGAFMLHVPYRGIAPAFTDLVGGQTQAMFPGLAAAMPHIRSQRVRPLAVTGTTRHPALPDVPTLEELGLKGFDAMQWYGVVGPAGMPADIVRQLNESLNAVLKAPDLREKLSVEAVEPMPMSAQQFGDYIRADIARWTKLARDRNIQLDN